MWRRQRGREGGPRGRQVTLCATASLVAPGGVRPGRLDLSAAQLHFVGDPPSADATSASASASPAKVRPPSACSLLVCTRGIAPPTVAHQAMPMAP